MNPAALKANLAEVPIGSTILVNEDAFDERNLNKVGYDRQPARGRLARRLPRDPGADDQRSRSRRARSSG